MKLVVFTGLVPNDNLSETYQVDVPLKSNAEALFTSFLNLDSE